MVKLDSNCKGDSNLNSSIHFFFFSFDNCVSVICQALFLALEVSSDFCLLLYSGRRDEQ